MRPDVRLGIEPGPFADWQAPARRCSRAWLPSLPPSPRAYSTRAIRQNALFRDVARSECALGHVEVASSVQSAVFRESPVASWGTCVHCYAVADSRGDAEVYTDRRKWALDAGLGHLCTLLRRDSPRQRPTLTPEEPHSGVIFLVMVHVSHRYREEDLLLGHPRAPSPMP